MKLLAAVLDKGTGDLTLSILTDEADPESVRTAVYGAGPRRANETKNAHERRLDDHVKSSLREARLLVKEERRRARKADDLAADPAETEVVALVAEAVDLDAATLEVKS